MASTAVPALDVKNAETKFQERQKYTKLAAASTEHFGNTSYRQTPTTGHNLLGQDVSLVLQATEWTFCLFLWINVEHSYLNSLTRRPKAFTRSLTSVEVENLTESQICGGAVCRRTAVEWKPNTSLLSNLAQAAAMSAGGAQQGKL